MFKPTQLPDYFLTSIQFVKRTQSDVQDDVMRDEK